MDQVVKHLPSMHEALGCVKNHKYHITLTRLGMYSGHCFVLSYLP
jgi:hypothetical protein